MQATEIRIELERIIHHDKLCKSRRKSDPQPCDCGHRKSVDLADRLVYDLLRKIR